MFWIVEFVQVVLGVFEVTSLCFVSVLEPVVGMEFVLLFIVCSILLL